MAIIACPNCSRRISDKAPICSWCGFQMGEVTEQDLEVYRSRRLRNARYRLNMISYGVISVFLAAFGWYWWDSRGFVQPPSRGPLILMGVAALGYVIVRAFLFRNRRLQKVIREKGALGFNTRRGG